MTYALVIQIMHIGLLIKLKLYKSPTATKSDAVIQQNTNSRFLLFVVMLCLSTQELSE